MSLNSVNTNTGATTALQSHDGTALQLAGVQKQVSAMACNENTSSDDIVMFSGSALYGSIAFTTAPLAPAGSVQALITPTGAGLNQQNQVCKQLNTTGNAVNYVNARVTYNSSTGALLDADLAKEAAQLTALQIRQQFDTQALLMADQAPQTLLSLFK